METSFIITFIGDDRPGLVEELSAVISDHQGNWQESRLSQLAGKFAGLIRVALPTDRGAPLEAALKQLSERGLSVRVHSLTDAPAGATKERSIRLTIMGPDRPGIVREIASALARQQINVVDMHSDVSSAPMSAEQLFTAHVEAEIPVPSDLEALSDTLEQIANDMSVDVHMEIA